MRHIIGEANGTLPFSKAVVHEDTVYVSGQVPIDPETGELVDGGIEVETIQTLNNVEAVLAEAGTSIDDVIKATLYIDDIKNFEAINEAYGNFFDEPYPARTACEVADLAVDAGIEIDVIAEI